MQSLIKFIFLLLLASCSASPTKPSVHSIAEFLKDTPYTHFQSACRVHDFDLKLAASDDGTNCAIKPDGSYYLRSLESLRYYSPQHKVIWENPLKKTHHSLVYSPVSGNILALSSQFADWNGKNTRFDLLLLLDQKGKVTKRFNTYDFWKKNPDLMVNTIPGSTNWYPKLEGLSENIFELTHTNSFIELTRTDKDGIKKVIGYAANCTFQRKILILNSALNHVEKVVDLNGRSSHGVTQIDDDRLIFYRNSTPQVPYSGADIYNMKTNEFTTLYQSNNPYLSSAACSNVQLLTPEKLLLSHSQCIGSENKAKYGLAVEFVNLKEKNSFYKILHPQFPHSHTYLIDGRKFVESRPAL